MGSEEEPRGARAPAKGSEAPRAFCRFRSDGSPSGGFWGLPPDGLCLSVFLIVRREGRPGEVLLGRIDPSADWDRIGALDPDRARASANGWMLPSSHLQFYEGPAKAATRIMDEQLGLVRRPIVRSLVVSETYPSRSRPERRQHWDLHFLQWVEAPTGWAPHHPAWNELRFVDPRAIAPSEFTRTHDEILELAGLRSAGPSFP